MDPLTPTPLPAPADSLLHPGFALWLSGLSWAFAFSNLQSVLSLLLTLASLVWVLVQIRSRLRGRCGASTPNPHCPCCRPD